MGSLRTALARAAMAGSLLLAGLAGGATVVAMSAGSAGAAATGTGETWRVNLGPGLVEANKPSERARISHDGKHVCYQTNASNLAAGDPALPDVYWSDLTDPAHPVTKRVSIGWDGSNANDQSTFCEISGDGRYVVFSSLANNLVKGSTQRGSFIRDMFEPDLSKATRNIAGNSDRPVVSDDGRYVSYNTLAPNNDVWVKDLQTGRTLQVTANPTPGSDVESLRPEMSGDGTHVVFASDLQLTASDTNAERDVYLADLTPWRAGGTTAPIVLVSVGLNGLAVGASSSRPGINGNGSVVSWQSASGGLTNGDTNNKMDGFVRDYRSNANGVTSLVTYNFDGTIPNAEGSRPQLDDSGDIVGFVSTSARIVKQDTNGREDGFIRNWKQEKSAGPGTASFLLAVSPSGDPGVCPGLAELDEGTSAISTRVYLSGDGTSAVFVSADCNLTLDAAHGGPDTNLAADIFVRHYGATGPPPPVKLNGLGRFFPSANPTRILDTRQPGRSRIVGGVPTTVQVAGLGGVPSDAALVAMNVTVAAPSAAGFLTVYPTGTALPNASNLNFAAGQTVPNLVVARLGGGGQVDVMLSGGTTDLLFDVVGWFGSSSTLQAGSRLATQAPARQLDTRVPGLAQGYAKVGPGQTIDVQVAPANQGITGVVVNLTGTGTTATTFVTAYPANVPRPDASNLNLVAGQTRPNLVMLGVSPQGRIKLFNAFGNVDLIVDLVATFTQGSLDEVPKGRLVALDGPLRIVDTRGTSPLTGPASRVQAVPALSTGGVSGAVAGLVMNVTATRATAGTFLTVYPPPTVPGTSNLNVVPGEDVPNLAVTGLAAGQVGVFNAAGSVDYIFDVTAVVIG